MLINRCGFAPHMTISFPSFLMPTYIGLNCLALYSHAVSASKLIAVITTAILASTYSATVDYYKSRLLLTNHFSIHNTRYSILIFVNSIRFFAFIQFLTVCFSVILHCKKCHSNFSNIFGFKKVMIAYIVLTLTNCSYKRIVCVTM